MTKKFSGKESEKYEFHKLACYFHSRLSQNILFVSTSNLNKNWLELTFNPKLSVV